VATVTYQVTMRDRTVETITGADAYQQEGQMTTFYRHEAARRLLDRWTTRVASFRTSEVLIIRRVDGREPGEPPASDEPRPIPLRRSG
jgi:hypothetical protein